MPRRFFLIVLDGCGAGAMPDAAEYGATDPFSNTLGNTARAVGGLEMPHLERLGWGNVTPMAGVAPRPGAPAMWGRLAEASKGKDTVTGHWEMMGIRTDVPFPTYPNGFPPEVIAGFEKIVGSGVLGNKPASGTEIIKELGEEHVRTGKPIVYTSADSVFQVAAHESPAIFGLDRLYRACQAARDKLLVPPHHVGRVIARPFVGSNGLDFRRTENRRDYPLLPPEPTVLDRLTDSGHRVHGIGKIFEIFSGHGLTTWDRTTNNADHLDALERSVARLPLRGEAATRSNGTLVFANLEDFDMLYGHRNDPVNFARLLAEFDRFVGERLLPLLRAGDLVGVTADHGNDPTTPSTDHSREYAPLLLFGPAIAAPIPLGDRPTFADWGATVVAWLGTPAQPVRGVPFPLPAGPPDNGERSSTI
jgi:phosphopentomutase